VKSCRVLFGCGLSERTPDAHRIADCGAMGHTGRFVVAELQCRGFALLALARYTTKLGFAGFAPRIRIARAAIDDPASFDRTPSRFRRHQLRRPVP
jgi:hypothetical protein